MADCIVLKNGGRIYPDELDTTPEHVRAGKRFIGSGSDEIQTGVMPVVDPIELVLSVNEVYEIPRGYHSGRDQISQAITIMDEPVTIVPGKDQQAVNTADKYLTSNISVEAVYNLRPEVIKAGVVVGEGDGAVVGTFEGFVD